MKSVFNSRYMGSKADEKHVAIALLGCPLDVTSSFRGGTKFAPDSIRKASWTLETYSPYLKQDLDEMMFYDAGNLELRPGDLLYSFELIETAVTEIVEKDKKILALGGEHLVTYPILKALKKHFREIQIVHFDAHCDLRDEYEGQKLSHATVMKRVKELGKGEIFQVGIRSGTRQEFEELRPVESPASLAARLNRNIPIYVSFDMDVFDPSLAAGVTTPEPGGLMFNEIMQYFSVFVGMNIVGADIVELAPDYDTTFVSSITASKVAREMLMLLHSQGDAASPVAR
ncbi:MAG TPA: agmatinase [Syntrophorhabdales bacterium]|nr:agmatinase [Syntrophorhabdales bacterium]